MSCLIAGSRAKCLWRAAREREFLITTGIREQSLACRGRPKRAQRLEVATLVGVYGSVERERLRRVDLAQRRKDGVRACRDNTGAQLVPVPAS